MCLAQGLQRSDAGEARTRDPTVLSQALPLSRCAPLGCLSFHLSVRHSVRHNLVSPQYLEKKRSNLTKFCKCIDIDKIQIGIVPLHISHIGIRIMALD